MRKYMLFALLFVGVFLSLSAYAYNEPTYNAWENKSRYAQEAGQSTPVRVLKMVRNAQNLDSGVANTSQMVSGDAVVYSTISDDGISVVYTATSADAAFAGIVVTTIPSSDSTTSTSAKDDVGRRNWGWIIVHGPAVARVNTAENHAAGDVMITSGDSGVVSTFIQAQTITMTSANVGRVAGAGKGFFFDASDTTGSAKVFVEAE